MVVTGSMEVNCNLDYEGKGERERINWGVLQKDKTDSVIYLIFNKGQFQKIKGMELQEEALYIDKFSRTGPKQYPNCYPPVKVL